MALWIVGFTDDRGVGGMASGFEKVALGDLPLSDPGRVKDQGVRLGLLRTVQGRQQEVCQRHRREPS